ncbi:DUF2141 domain-containing protein [Kordiimonas aquimaris]|uniref:DUF2141 domain-containing protein n=1 Tax=Kordiimonas aquimaris TaxID=707591 RepID=UPI0021D156D8|nr:DUF2141 domain-containing protein [Kordiimonas aquimaris]
MERANNSGVVAEDGSCIAPDGIAVISVSVDNIQVIEGNLRAQIYSGDPEEFLEKGKKLVRVDVPVVTTDTSTICVPLPAPGTYALVVMHDKNSNGKADFFSEGFGFSNNPKLSFGPPDAEDVMINVAPGVNEQSVTLNYIFGADNEKKDKRRKLRRR